MPLNPLQYFSPASEEAGGEDLHNLHLIRREEDGDDGDDGDGDGDEDGDDRHDQDGDDNDDDADYVEKRMQGFASPSASAVDGRGEKQTRPDW